MFQGRPQRGWRKFSRGLAEARLRGRRLRKLQPYWTGGLLASAALAGVAWWLSGETLANMAHTPFRFAVLPLLLFLLIWFVSHVLMIAFD
jgi:hypothetical protein